MIVVNRIEYDKLAKSFGLYAETIEKARKANIGEIRDWHGQKMKKVAEGKWEPVSEGRAPAKEKPETSKGPAKKEEPEAKGPGNEPAHKVGDKVTLDKEQGDFTVTKVDSDGTYHVTSADGKKGFHVSENHMKANENAGEEKAKEPAKAGNGDGNGPKGPENKKQLEPTYGRKQIPANEFKASEYKETYDDDRIDTTQAGISEAIRQVLELPIMKKHPEFEYRLRSDLLKAEKEPETVNKFRKSGEGAEAVYTPARQKIHEQILNELLSDDNVKRATPKEGQEPTFQILGGRGGSGKSTFDKRKSDAGVYNKNEVIVVDPDDLKERIANASGEKWEGWKAKAYHEESSDLSKMLMKRAMALGLNIVMDITMSNADKQIDELKMAKALGYKTGAYYMHVPKQESFKRAMKRYLQNPGDDSIEDYSGRLVPPDVLLSMTGNEANFDKVKEFADDWSFYDNFIPFEKGADGKNKYKAEKIAQKGE